MPTASSRAAILKLPKALKVTIEIDADRVQDGETVGMIGLRLVRMGGRFLEWKPNLACGPAVARFEFSTPHERAQFVAQAALIPGVSIVARSG